MTRYIIWAADRVVFSEVGTNYTIDGDISSIVQQQLVETFTAVAEKHPSLTIPSGDAIIEDIDRGINEKGIFKKHAAPDLLKELSETYKQKEEKRRLNNFIVLPGIKDAIHAFHKEGYKNLIVGFRATEFIESVLQNNDLKNYMEVIKTQPGKLRLPNVAVWDELIQPKYPNIEKENTVIIAKESVELLFASSVGVDAIWVRAAQGDWERCTTTFEPKRTIYSTENYHKVISSYFKDKLEKESAPSMSPSH